MKVEMSGYRSSMEMLEGRDEFHGPETHPSYGEKATMLFHGLELEHLGLEDQSLEL